MQEPAGAMSCVTVVDRVKGLILAGTYQLKLYLSAIPFTEGVSWVNRTEAQPAAEVSQA